VPNFFEALRFRYWHCNERLDVGCRWMMEHILESIPDHNQVFCACTENHCTYILDLALESSW
jgi:hypothetical protein